MSVAYAVVTVAHVLAAVVSFGALGATGAYARAARLAAGTPSPAVRRYFAPGRNLAASALYVVPVFGFALLWMHHFDDASRPYPWVGLAAWVAAIGVAHAALWPAEATIQRALAGGDGGVARGAAMEVACRRCERAAAATSMLFLLALFFMVVQPG